MASCHFPPWGSRNFWEYQKCKKTTIAVAVASVAGLMATAANAALDPAVTTAISTAGTDGATLGGLILAVLIGIAAFKWLRGAK